MKERLLIVGNGGREHAIGWQLNKVGSRELYFAPGNYGTSQIGKNVDIGVNEIDRLARFASDNKIDLTVVGPEAPLEKGIANAFKKDNLAIFAPTYEAAILETNKARAIEFMERHNIPHPQSKIFDNVDEALAFVENPPWDEVVVKTPGLASGKGVTLPDSLEEARQAIREIMIDKKFDDGKEVIIQERLKGKELSLICFTDGKTIVPLVPARDSKRLKDNDKGPNTGGMGAFAPVPEVTRQLQKEIYDTILAPTIRGMEEEEHPFQGWLYAGLMLTKDGPKVLEFNARLGDPEAQVLMMLLKSDLYPAVKHTTDGRLHKRDVVFRNGATVCVVLAAEGYPSKPINGDIVHGLNNIIDPNVQVFHAGTKLNEDGQVQTNGGRIVGITAYGKNIAVAREKVYFIVRNNIIYFRGEQFKLDIARNIGN